VQLLRDHGPAPSTAVAIPITNTTHGRNSPRRSRPRHTPKEQASVRALRANGADVDVSIRARKEWARLYQQNRPAEV
jgi:hypothetical protein